MPEDAHLRRTEGAGLGHVGDHIYDDHEVATLALGHYIDGYYNPRRRHSPFGYVSPIEFELKSHAPAMAAGSDCPFGGGKFTGPFPVPGGLLLPRPWRPDERRTFDDDDGSRRLMAPRTREPARNSPIA